MDRRRRSRLLARIKDGERAREEEKCVRRILFLPSRFFFLFINSPNSVGVCRYYAYINENEFDEARLLIEECEKDSEREYEWIDEAKDLIKRRKALLKN